MRAPSPRIDFSDEEVAILLEYKRQLAESVLQNSPRPALPEPLSRAEAYGVFVTFRRQGELRACRGRFGTCQPLGDLMAGVVEDTVLDDPRFPAITAEELPYLHVDLSLMHTPREVEVAPEERAAAVEIGRHGVVLSHPRGRGLLLPQVASERGWSALQFLQALAQKAGLSIDAWKDPAAKLMTFEARVWDMPPLAIEPTWDELTPEDFSCLRNIVETVGRRGTQSAAGLSAALMKSVPTEFGLAVHTRGGRVGVSMGKDQSLSQLAAQVGQTMRNDPEVARITRLTIFGQPLVLRAVDHPQRHAHLVRSVAVARTAEKWSIQFPGGKDHPVSAAVAALASAVSDWKSNPTIRVTSFNTVLSREVRPSAEMVRSPARAGQFYPALAEEIRAEVHRYLSLENGPPRACRSVMLPHAGWAFCGEVIGRTLSRAIVPRTVVVVGPKHTPSGPDWSVSSASSWTYPGGEVPVAVELRDRLCSMVSGLAVEAEAHRMEHAVEVLVPFLHARQPQLQILPIVLGPMSYSQTERLARALAVLLNDSSEPILLAISSDLNHFAPEPENRRRDMLAVNAFCSGDAGQLFDTVMQNDISMCGVIPAVTVLRALHATGTAPQPQLVHYANSGAKSGDLLRVVGYAGCIVE